MNSMTSKLAVGNAFSSHQDLASFPINCRSSWKKCFKSNQRSVRVLLVHWWSGASTGLMPHSLTTAASPHLLGCCYNEVMSKSSFPTTPVLLRGPIQAIWNKNDLMSHSITTAVSPHLPQTHPLWLHLNHLYPSFPKCIDILNATLICNSTSLQPAYPLNCNWTSNPLHPQAILSRLQSRRQPRSITEAAPQTYKCEQFLMEKSWVAYVYRFKKILYLAILHLKFGQLRKEKVRKQSAEVVYFLARQLA